MQNIKFTYQGVRGNKIDADLKNIDIDGFESDWRNKVDNIYKDSLISPEVIVILSEDGKEIINSTLLVDGVLKSEKLH
ncbi:hypothetical protein ACFGVS_19100 [Mucilaginibacter sp. AW1-7]|uniref:hypothetical protein n=1 Tax=Mucilaginibacter sp. AW1-7 TaxID=3349874 RepID=UPI003F73313D